MRLRHLFIEINARVRSPSPASIGAESITTPFPQKTTNGRQMYPFLYLLHKPFCVRKGSLLPRRGECANIRIDGLIYHSHLFVHWIWTFVIGIMSTSLLPFSLSVWFVRVVMLCGQWDWFWDFVKCPPGPCNRITIGRWFNTICKSFNNKRKYQNGWPGAVTADLI